MAIEANVTNQQITASVGETQIDVSVSGGVGPTGPQGPAGTSNLPAGTEGQVLTYVSGAWTAADATGGTWSTITGKPSTFAPSAHASSHGAAGGDPITVTVGQVTGLQAALDARAGVDHNHGAITSDGLIQGNTAPGRLVVTTDGGELVTASAVTSSQLPNATTTTRGGVIVGTGLGVTTGTVSVTYGTTAGTACQGNDSRLSDARTPTDTSVTEAKLANDLRNQIIIHPFLLAGM